MTLRKVVKKVRSPSSGHMDMSLHLRYADTTHILIAWGCLGISEFEWANIFITCFTSYYVYPLSHRTFSLYTYCTVCRISLFIVQGKPLSKNKFELIKKLHTSIIRIISHYQILFSYICPQYKNVRVPLIKLFLTFI